MEGRIFKALQKLEQIRKEEKVFAPDADVYTYDVKDDSVLGILREADGERFLGLFNFSDQPKTAWMQEDGTYRNLLTGEEMTLKDVPLQGSSFLWATLSSPAVLKINKVVEFSKTC